MASGRELCYCMIAGIAMCYILTFFLVSQPSIPSCALTRVLMGLSMSAIYAAIITKTNRLARVFSPQSAQRPGCITPRAQVRLSLFLAKESIPGPDMHGDRLVPVCWLPRLVDYRATRNYDHLPDKNRSCPHLQGVLPLFLLTTSSFPGHSCPSPRVPGL